MEALTLEARRLGQSGRQPKKAVMINTRILELDPDNLPALTRRGLSYFKLDNYPAAKEDLSRALSLYLNSSLVKDTLTKIERGWDAALSRARKRSAEKRRRAKEEEVRRKAAEEVRRRAAEELRSVEKLTGFEEAYALGVAASKALSPNFPLAIAAFKKAYKLDPRRKVSPGKEPDTKLFEVPTRLARAYRLNGQLYEAEQTYKCVLDHHDSRFARVGLAAVHEDNGEHVQALRLYESVLARHPRDAYALRGVGRTFYSLGRIEEAVEAYNRAAEAAEDRKDIAAVASALDKMRKELHRKGEVDRARQVSLALERLWGSEGSGN